MFSPLSSVTTDDTEVSAVDNSPQGIYTIGDIRERIEKKWTANVEVS